MPLCVTVQANQWHKTVSSYKNKIRKTISVKSCNFLWCLLYSIPFFVRSNFSLGHAITKKILIWEKL